MMYEAMDGYRTRITIQSSQLRRLYVGLALRVRETIGAEIRESESQN